MSDAVVGDVLITMAPPGRNAFFEAYNLSGDQLKSFGEMIEDQDEKGIILDGNVIGAGENQEFIYGGRYIGAIARYGAGGERRFVVRTIDGVPPKILSTGASQQIKPNSPMAVLSMSILGNELYVLSGVRADGTGSAGGQVLDVYDKRDGNYLR